MTESKDIIYNHLTMAMKIGPYIYGTPSNNVTKHMKDLLITMEKPSHPYHEQKNIKPIRVRLFSSFL